MLQRGLVQHTLALLKCSKELPSFFFTLVTFTQECTQDCVSDTCEDPPVFVTMRLEGCTTEALSNRLDNVNGVFIMVAMLLLRYRVCHTVSEDPKPTCTALLTQGVIFILKVFILKRPEGQLFLKVKNFF